MAWLKRFVDRVRGSHTAGGGSDQVRRVSLTLYRRGLHGDARTFFCELLEQLPAGEPLEDATLAVLSAELRGAYGQELDRIGSDYDEHLGFWRRLAERFGQSAYAAACYADTLLLGGQQEEAARWFFRALELDPALIYEFDEDLCELARTLGGDTWFEYQLAALAGAIEGEAAGSDDDERADLVRELYGELLDEHASDPARLERILAVGQRIGELTRDELMPRAFVRRGSSRRK